MAGKTQLIQDLDAQEAGKTMPGAIEAVAVRLWRAEAERAAPNVAAMRTAKAFSDESLATRDKWLGLATAALTAYHAHLASEGLAILSKAELFSPPEQNP